MIGYPGNDIPRTIKVTAALTADDIADVAKNNILALTVPEFFDASLCDEVAKRILVYDQLGHYHLQPDVKKLGRAIYDITKDAAEKAAYYKFARSSLLEIRQLFHPYLSPIDKLRLELQEIWPAGSVIERLHNELMFCGLLRIFLQGSEALPHQDMTHWDVPKSEAAKTLITQIGANIYLSTTDAGGELELWGYGAADITDYNTHIEPGGYGLDCQKIGQPAGSIAPSKGDLILFNARNIHSVKPIRHGVRIAASSFIGYRGVSAPLTIYS